MNDQRCPTTAERINELFATFHRRSEPERSNDDIAAQLSLIGIELTVADLIGLRSGAKVASPDVLSALAQLFGVPVAYLCGTEIEAIAVHRKLLLLRSVRDAGVERLALRGSVDCDSEVISAYLSDVLDPA